MFTQVNRRLVAALMALAVVISNVIAPVSPAFAHDSQSHTSGTKGQMSSLDTPAIPVQRPIPMAPTCHEPGSLRLVDTGAYTWSTNPVTSGTTIGPGVYDATATVRDGVDGVFQNQERSITFTGIIVLDALCQPPAPKVEYTQWSYGIVNCSTLSATQTRIKTSTPYIWSNLFNKWVLDVLHTSITTETQQRSLTSVERMLCTPKPSDTVTHSDWTDGTFQCGDTTVDRTRETTTTKYTWNGSEWVANTTTKTERQSRPATTQEQMSCASQAQPTCETNGTLTLPAYKGDWHKDYKYVVKIGLNVKTYDADQTVTIHNIPQGATVTVKLVSDDCFHDVIFTKNYTFNTLDCIDIPAAPKQVDECGLNNAHWIVPADTNEVHWYLNAKGELIAKAVGGKFTNHHRYINFGVAKDSNVACPPTVVTPVKPQIVDCKAILPITLGITYKEVYLDANGNIIDPSQAGITATRQGVVATANAGYQLSMTNRDDGSYLSVLDFTGMNCGKGDVTPPIVTPPVATTTAASLPTPAELPHTGSSLSGLLVTLLATLSTYGAVYFLQPKRR